MATLIELLNGNAPNIQSIGEHLDALSPNERLEQTRALRRGHQRLLFDIANGFKPVSTADIVGTNVPAMTEVVHNGKNSLPLFTRFAKVFVRPEASSNELWGYNRNSAFLETVVGPGYFVARNHSVPGEVLVDYLEVPPSKPAAWPEIISNSSRLSYFVYNQTQDILRGVSKHVSIGRATKRGKDLPAWFVLCKEG
ncbi:MAG: hypothetical protein R3A47_11175 [Polyangiales bacterium]